MIRTINVYDACCDGCGKQLCQVDDRPNHFITEQDAEMAMRMANWTIAREYARTFHYCLSCSADRIIRDKQ